ncbi:MAG: hypothetical protein PVH07_04010 [Chloroflexota bacterium]
MAVGAQHIGEEVGVGVVVLVAAEAIAGAQGLDVAAGDDHDGQPGREQRADDRAVGPLDGDPADPPGGESSDEPAQAGGGVLDLRALDDRTALIDDADDVAPTGPVDARVRGDGGDRRHPCLLAGASSLGASLW